MLQKIDYNKGITMFSRLVESTYLPENPTKKQFKSYRYNEAYKLKAVYMLSQIVKDKKNGKLTPADYERVANKISKYLNVTMIQRANKNFHNYGQIDRRRVSIGRTTPSPVTTQLRNAGIAASRRKIVYPGETIKYDLNTIKNYLHEWFFTPIKTIDFVNKYGISRNVFYRWMNTLNLTGRIYYYDKNGKKRYKTIINFNEQKKIDLFLLARISKFNTNKKRRTVELIHDVYTAAAYEEFITKLEKRL